MKQSGYRQIPTSVLISKNIEVTFEPEDWNKVSEKPWTIHYENENKMDRGIGEYFATVEEADKKLAEILETLERTEIKRLAKRKLNF